MSEPLSLPGLKELQQASLAPIEREHFSVPMKTHLDAGGVRFGFELEYGHSAPVRSLVIVGFGLSDVGGNNLDLPGPSLQRAFDLSYPVFRTRLAKAKAVDTDLISVNLPKDIFWSDEKRALEDLELHVSLVWIYLNIARWLTASLPVRDFQGLRERYDLPQSGMEEDATIEQIMADLEEAKVDTSETPVFMMLFGWVDTTLEQKLADVEMRVAPEARGETLTDLLARDHLHTESNFPDQTAYVEMAMSVLSPAVRPA